MKKLILTLFLLAGLFASAAAQDIIRTKDGRTIEAKIVSVNDASLTYKRFNNPNGPTFSMALNQIESIQYENGTGDVYAGRTKTYSDLKYKELKNLYTKRDYKKTSGQPYSPFWAGLASFFIPGLGECIDGEWGRGLCICLGNMALYGVQLRDTDIVYDDKGNVISSSVGTVGFVAGLGRIALNIWSIVDARKIAKIKDAYWQDCFGYSAVTLSMDPYFAYTPVPGSGLQPVTGLSLKLTF